MRPVGANLVQKMPLWLRRWLIRNMTYWPPFFGAGIKVENVSSDFLNITTSMKLRWYNRNYVGTHFGGSMYSMTDPFYMLMLLQKLGKDFIVWDLAARIQFKSPGRGKLHAHFSLTEEEIEKIRQALLTQEKWIVKKSVDIVDERGTTVARVRKLIYICRKTRQRSSLA